LSKSAANILTTKAPEAEVESQEQSTSSVNVNVVLSQTKRKKNLSFTGNGLPENKKTVISELGEVEQNVKKTQI